MKKSLLATAVLTTLCGVAHADDGSSVTLYGIFDAAVGVVGHSANASPNSPGTVNPVGKVAAGTQPVSGVFNGGLSDSRWGIRGNEDLGGGMSAFFNLESGINVNNGNLNNAAASIAGPGNTLATASALNGQLFNRGAYVGLKDITYGSISLGRTTTLGFDTIIDYDPMHAAQLFSPLGFSGSYSAGGITEGSRTDNNIKYTNRIDNFNYGASYSLGGVAGAYGAGSTFGGNIGYEANGFGVQATYYSARDAVHSGAIVGQTGNITGTQVGNLTLANDKDVLLAAKYANGPLTIKGGYEHYELTAPSDPGAYSKSTNYFGYTGALTAATFGTKTNVYFFGGDYQLTPNFDISTGIYDTQQVASYKVPSGNQIQYALLADYNLSKRTDLYAGYMLSKFNGQEFDGFERSNYILASGMRMKF